MDITECYRQRRKTLSARVRRRSGVNEHDAEDAFHDAVVESLTSEIDAPVESVLWQKTRRNARNMQRHEQIKRKPRPVEPQSYVQSWAATDESDWPEDERQALSAWRLDQTIAGVAKRCRCSVWQARQTLTRVAVRLR